MVSTNRGRGPEAIYEAMRVVVDQGLRADGSAFDAGRGAWTRENFESLKTAFIDAPDEGSDPFMDKLHRQLAPCTPDELLLMAELLFVHLLITVAISGPKKREIIDSVLALGANAAIPEELGAALDAGAVNPGTFFNTARNRQINFLVRFGLEWKSTSASTRSSALNDPWAFDAFLQTIELESAFTQMEALKHLVFPGPFEAISSLEHKKRIIGALGDMVDDADHLDRKIQLIRTEFTPRFGESFDFYSDELLRLWREQGWKWPETLGWSARFLTHDRFPEWELDWKRADGEALRSELERFVETGEVGQLKTRLKTRNLTPWRASSRWVDWAEANPAEAAAGVRAAWSEETPGERIDAFLAAVPADVIPGAGTRAAVAAAILLADDPEQFPLFRVTVFEHFAKLVKADKAPDGSPGEIYEWGLALLDSFSAHLELRGHGATSRLVAQSLAFVIARETTDAPLFDDWSDDDKTAFISWRGKIKESDDDEADDTEDTTSSSVPTVNPTGTLDDLADSLHLDRKWIRRLVTLLDHRPQLVLQGPPGTGKTYVAQKLAEHLSGGADGVSLVQFHASYAYEDFVQGWRPVEDGKFGLMDGPLRRLAKRAIAEPDRDFFMVIDEMNRGDVARVFGELFYLLENRDQQIELQYDPQPFALPSNIKFLATMNTADRSIAIVDGALRRRFHFVDFTPAKPPVDALLRSWLELNKPSMTWVADVVDEANHMLDADLAIGPSHFLDPDLDNARVELVWEHSVLSYLAEQLYGRSQDLADFGLDRLRKQAEGGDDDAPAAD